MMKTAEKNKINQQIRNSQSQIRELGQQLGLNREQIYSILNNTHHITEEYSCVLGPPHYPASFYGTISINEFNNVFNKRERKKK
jgi:hypothetical protein